MKLSEVRQKFLKFYEERGHKIIPSASLVPENDPTTLFTGSGMQPLLPFLLGQKHPAGVRLCDSQKCFRSGDIEDIGDNRHTTCFEMLGNWSLGDYFKQEQIPWVFEFLTKEIGLNPEKLFITTFIGDEANGIPRDDEAVEIWQAQFAKLGIEAIVKEIGSEEDGASIGMEVVGANGEKKLAKIFAYNSKKNWWSRSGVPEKMPVGEPGGGDTEMFYDFGTEHDKKFGENCHPNCDCGRFVEIGNSVFMEYKKTDKGFEKLAQKNVDFGGGLERITMASNDIDDIFAIDIFQKIIGELEKLSEKKYDDKIYQASFRIIADHLKSAVFLIADGVMPSNSEQGYFVRRLLRRAVRHWDKLGIKTAGLSTLVLPILEYYNDSYPENLSKKDFVIAEIEKEENKFRKTLEKGLREFNKKIADKKLSGKDAFDLYQSFGFPIELTEELAKEFDIIVDTVSFQDELHKHQALSRSGSEKKFKGGLGDTSEKTIQYHTTTHLLHQALREVLGEEVGQRGSNITPERLRFDFTFPRKMTDEEKRQVEDLINQKISEKLPVTRVELTRAEAEQTGALHFFGEKYGETVSVYYIGESLADAWSKEFCGGPHIQNTGELGHFKIVKEEAVSAGVRRIKAVLE